MKTPTWPSKRIEQPTRRRSSAVPPLVTDSDEPNTDSKPRRSLGLQSSKKLYRHNHNPAELPPHAKPHRIQSFDRHNIPELPLDVMVNIISRLPVTSIIRCKSLSKSFNNLISDPSFSHIYLTNRSNYSCILLVNRSKPPSLDLLEFDQRDIYNSSNLISSEVAIFNLDRLPGSRTNGTLFSIWGYCNGLLCLLKIKSGLHTLFVTNPILGQFIPLPQSAVPNIGPGFAYGIGHSQLTNTYKVLRIITTNLSGGTKCRGNSEIFTIGSDKKWRQVNVPYNMKYFDSTLNPEYPMVSFRSALHWVVKPVIVAQDVNLEPNFGGSICICAFDVTDEKVATLPLPHVVAASPTFKGLLCVLFEKLCLWRRIRWVKDYELWVMDEYGSERSWTKKLVVKLLNIRHRHNVVMAPLTISADGVIVITDGHLVIAYDTNKEKCLSVHEMKVFYRPVPFVPCFVSPSSIIQ